MKDNTRLFTAQTPNVADSVTLARPRTQRGRQCHGATPGSLSFPASPPLKAGCVASSGQRPVSRGDTCCFCSPGTEEQTRAPHDTSLVHRHRFTGATFRRQV